MPERNFRGEHKRYSDFSSIEGRSIFAEGNSMRIREEGFQSTANEFLGVRCSAGKPFR